MTPIPTHPVRITVRWRIETATNGRVSSHCSACDATMISTTADLASIARVDHEQRHRLGELPVAA